MPTPPPLCTQTGLKPNLEALVNKKQFLLTDRLGYLVQSNIIFHLMLLRLYLTETLTHGDFLRHLPKNKILGIWSLSLTRKSDFQDSTNKRESMPKIRNSDLFLWEEVTYFSGKVLFCYSSQRYNDRQDDKGGKGSAALLCREYPKEYLAWRRGGSLGGMAAVTQWKGYAWEIRKPGSAVLELWELG